MKKRISLLVVLVLAFTMVCGSIATVNAATKPTKMTISASSKTAYVGTTVQIKVKSVTPKKASKSVTYKTSNKKVATVSSKGVVTAKAPGKATITVTSKSNKKLKKTVKITVKDPAKGISEIKGATIGKDFDITKDHVDGFIFVTDSTVQNHVFNKTDHTMVIFDNVKFGKNAVLRIENTMTLGKGEVGAMPKFSGGYTFEVEGCGSCTAYKDASFNGDPIAMDKSSITSGKYYSLEDHSEIAEPDELRAIEIIQYYEGGTYKVLVNGMA